MTCSFTVWFLEKIIEHSKYNTMQSTDPSRPRRAESHNRLWISTYVEGCILRNYIRPQSGRIAGLQSDRNSSRASRYESSFRKAKRSRKGLSRRNPLDISSPSSRSRAIATFVSVHGNWAKSHHCSQETQSLNIFVARTPARTSNFCVCSMAQVSTWAGPRLVTPVCDRQWPAVTVRTGIAQTFQEALLAAPSQRFSVHWRQSLRHPWRPAPQSGPLR